MDSVIIKMDCSFDLFSLSCFLFSFLQVYLIARWKGNSLILITWFLSFSLNLQSTHNKIIILLIFDIYYYLCKGLLCPLLKNREKNWLIDLIANHIQFVSWYTSHKSVLKNEIKYTLGLPYNISVSA